MDSLYVFIDESGNFDFSNGQGATEWLGLTSLTTTDASEGVMELYQVKHNLIETGYDVERFHATEDKQIVRDAVFPVLAGLQNARVDHLAIRKRRLNPDWRRPERFYPAMIPFLLQSPFNAKGLDVQQFERIVIFMDKVQLPKRRLERMIGAIKIYLKPRLGAVPYSIHIHDSRSHLYLQATDYFCWAVSVRRERDERRPYDVIKHLVRNDFDIFERGHTDWY